jgi:hypothetical protein
VRDWALIVLAIETIVLGAVALFALVQVLRLVGLIRRHLDHLAGLAGDVLGTTAQTAKTVQGTTTFVGNQAARPVIELISVIRAASHFARAVFTSQRSDDKKGSE